MIDDELITSLRSHAESVQVAPTERLMAGIEQQTTRRRRRQTAAALVAVAAVIALITVGAVALTSPATTRIPTTTQSTSPPPVPALTVRSLHITKAIPLGGRPSAETEAPDGAVFYSRGDVVYVIDGNQAPAVAENLPSSPLALAADAKHLWVVTPTTIYEFARDKGAQLHTWPVPAEIGGRFTPINEAGIYLGPTTAYLWTLYQACCDVYPSVVSRISFATNELQPMDRDVYSGDAIDGDEFFFASFKNNGLAEIGPTGPERFGRRDSNLRPTGIYRGRLVVAGNSRYFYADEQTMRRTVKIGREFPGATWITTTSGVIDYLASGDRCNASGFGCRKNWIEAGESPSTKPTARLEVAGLTKMLSNGSIPTFVADQHHTWVILRVAESAR